MLKLQVKPKGVPPEFTLMRNVNAVIEEAVLLGLSPLAKFEFDNTRVHVPGIWRPSSLRRCMRKQVYKATRSPKGVRLYDETRQKDFDRGHIFGAWFAAYVSALEGKYGFSDVRCEEILSCDQTQIGGKADFTLQRYGHKYVGEVKSKINPEALNKISPNKDDLAQLNDYMSMAGAEAGWLIYFGVGTVMVGPRKRYTMVAKEFFHRRSEQVWQNSVQQTQLLSWFYQDQEKLAPKTSNTFLECPSCEWKGLCDGEVSPKRAIEREEYEEVLMLPPETPGSET